MWLWSCATGLVYDTIETVPPYHLALEALLVGWIIWLVFRKSYKPSDVTELTEKEKEELIAEWQPEPLVPETPADHPALNPLYVEGKLTKYVKIEGKTYLNAATLNFLGLVGDDRIEEAASKAIFKYGVGSCGPRGFYGTIDVHLDLETRLAQFMGCEEAILYSYGFPTVASAIPAYAKRGDVIFCDKGVNFAVQKGLQASRSRLEFFEHNNMQDLERLLEAQAEKDKHNLKKAKATRRFLVVEGLYLNYGDICPLKKLVEFKWKYKVRLFIDESCSFGVLGANGRGVTEHFGVDVENIDMICASLENAIASTGGFCCGRTFVIDHQRLSGLGYCFSASSPPLLATAALESLKIIENEPERLDNLRSMCKLMHEKLNKLTYFRVLGQEISPIFHLIIKNPESINSTASNLLQSLTNLVRQNGVVITKAAYLMDQEMFPPEPSIRIAVSAHFDESDVQKIVDTIEQASKQLFI